MTLFGHAVAPLLHKRLYMPTTDMGTDNIDIRYMVEAVGLRLKRRELRGVHSSYYTALTVFTGLKQAMRHVGAISTSRGAIFNPHGLDVQRLNQLATEAGSHVVDLYTSAERMDRAALFELPVDVLCPCARHHSLHPGNIPRVMARIICPGANNPVTPEAEQMLFARGILSLPDFVTNCGGVLGGTTEFASVRREQIASFIEHQLGARIAWLLDEAARQHVSAREIAVPLALQRFDQVRRSAAHPTIIDRLFTAGLDLYRRGWLPDRLVASRSLPYFERSLAPLHVTAEFGEQHGPT